MEGKPTHLVEMLLTTPTSNGRLQLQVERSGVHLSGHVKYWHTYVTHMGSTPHPHICTVCLWLMSKITWYQCVWWKYRITCSQVSMCIMEVASRHLILVTSTSTYSCTIGPWLCLHHGTLPSISSGSRRRWCLSVSSHWIRPGSCDLSIEIHQPGGL